MKQTKLTVNGNVVPDICPKCKEENTMYAVSDLKWGKVNKWQHFSRCQLCGYETKVN